MRTIGEEMRSGSWRNCARARASSQLLLTGVNTHNRVVGEIAGLSPSRTLLRVGAEMPAQRDERPAFFHHIFLVRSSQTPCRNPARILRECIIKNGPSPETKSDVAEKPSSALFDNPPIHSKIAPNLQLSPYSSIFYK